MIRLCIIVSVVFRVVYACAYVYELAYGSLNELAYNTH